MDIGWVGQSFQSGSPVAPAAGTPRVSEDEGADPFESVLNSEVAVSAEAEATWALWPVVAMALPVDTVAPAMAAPEAATPGEAETIVTEAVPLTAALAAPEAVIMAEAVADPALLAMEASESPGSTLLAEAMPASLPMAVDERDSVDTAPPQPDILAHYAPVESIGSPPTINTTLLTAESQNTAFKAPVTELGDHPAEALTSMPGEVQVVARAQALPKSVPVTSAYWRLVLEGVMDGAEHVEAASPDAPTLTRHAQAASLGGVVSMPDGADAVQNSQPMMANLGSETVKDAPARGEIAEDLPSSANPQDEKGQQITSDLAAAPRPPVMPLAGFAPVAQDGALLLPSHTHASAAPDALSALGQPGAGGSDLSIRAASIEQVQTDAGLEVTEIRLDPEELGRLRIRLEGEGDALRVRVEVERPETLDLLRRNGDRLVETLREAGYDQTDMQFSGWSEQRHSAAAQTKPELEMSAEPESPNLTPMPSPSLARPSVAATGLNLRL